MTVDFLFEQREQVKHPSNLDWSLRFGKNEYFESATELGH